MATLGASFVDLIDIYKQQDGNGQYIPVIEMLKEKLMIKNQIIQRASVHPNFKNFFAQKNGANVNSRPTLFGMPI